MAFEINAGTAALRILAREVLNVVLRTICNLLLMYSHCAMAMHASNGVTRSPYRF